MGPMDPTSQVVQHRLNGSSEGNFGNDGKGRRPTKTVVFLFIKLSVVIWWSEVAMGGRSKAKKFRRI